MIVYLPCKLGEIFTERTFVAWENGKRVYKDGDAICFRGFHASEYQTRCLSIPCIYADKGFREYDALGEWCQEYFPKYKISIDVRSTYKLSEIGFPSGRTARLFGIEKKGDSLFADFVTSDRYEHLKYRIKNLVQYAELDEEPAETKIIYEPEEREEIEMARDFKSGRNSILKKIAENKALDDAPVIISIDKLKEHPDNEYLFGMQGIHHMAEGIKKNGWKGAIEVWDNGDGTYTIYSGHRRVFAMLELGYDSIRCFVYPKPEKETVQRRELLGANLFGRNSVNANDPIHTARQIAYHRATMEMEKANGEYEGGSDTRGELAKDFGISSSQIYKYESLLSLTTELQEKVEQGEIPLAQASSMAVMEEEKQELCWDAICELKNKLGEDKVSRDDVQKVVNHVKGMTDISARGKDVLEAAFRVQEEKAEEVLDGQVEIVNTNMDTKVYAPVENTAVHGEQEEYVPADKNEITENNDIEETDNVPKTQNSIKVQEDEKGAEKQYIDETVNNAGSQNEEAISIFNAAYEKFEAVLLDGYDYEDKWKDEVKEKLDKLSDMIKKEKARLDG